MKKAMRKCRTCGVEFERKRLSEICCSVPCALAYIKTRKEKKRLAEMRKLAMVERAKRTAMRHQLETVPDLTKKAQAVFNRFIRLRDTGLPCISCGKPHINMANLFDAGHYRSVGAAPHLRFDECNVHGQCKHCNNHLSGNIVMYRQGLIVRIGQAEVDRIEADNQQRRYSKDDLRETAALYRRRARELER